MEPPGPWFDRAACRRPHIPQGWFVGDRRRMTYGLAICRRCPVLDQCAAWADTWPTVVPAPLVVVGGKIIGGQRRLAKAAGASSA